MKRGISLSILFLIGVILISGSVSAVCDGILGDFNGDNCITSEDYIYFLENYYTAGDYGACADMDENGKIDFSDLILIRNNVGRCFCDGILGDVNGDNYVTEEDADLVDQMIAGIIEEDWCGDFDENGEIDINDTLAITNYVESLKDYSCDDDQTILTISGVTNAHGELYNETAYSTEICFDDIFQQNYSGPEGEEHICQSTSTLDNYLISLVLNTNAHAEINNLQGYPWDVCYGDLQCRNTTEECTAPERCVVTLSSDTNAHLAVCGEDYSYPINVCCNSSISALTPSEQIYWSKENVEITESYVGDTVNLVWKNTGLPQGTTVYLDIKEDNYDENIKDNLECVINAEGDCSLGWTITQADWDIVGHDLNAFYFIVNDNPTKRSGNLQIFEVDPCSGKGLCEDYETQETCEANTCEGINYPEEWLCSSTISFEVGDDSCDYLRTCDCEWDTSCDSMYDDTAIDSNCGGDRKTPIEADKCHWDTDSSGDCSVDSVLRLHLVGTIEWGADNEYSLDEINNGKGPSDELGDYVQEGSIYHWDPVIPSSGKRISESCSENDKIVPCPAQIKLPFFTLKNLILTLVVIGLIYYVFFYRKSLGKNNSKKK